MNTYQITFCRMFPGPRSVEFVQAFSPQGAVDRFRAEFPFVEYGGGRVLTVHAKGRRTGRQIELEGWSFDMSNTVKIKKNGDVKLVLTREVAEVVCAIMGKEYGANASVFPFCALEDAIGNPLRGGIERRSDRPDDVAWRIKPNE